MPSVAVVIPLYNHERYIREALESVLAQTLPVDRIVIIDDGSNDRSAEVAREVADSRILLVTQENAGAHNALNRGVQLASDCDVVAVLNSDDRFHPERIERCLAYLEAHPQHEVVCTKLQMINSDGGELPASDPKARWLDGVWAVKPPGDELVEWLGVANFAKTSSNFVFRSGFGLAHPFRDYRYIHDYYFLVFAGLHRKVGVLEEPLLFYRTHPTNTIKSGASDAVTREMLRLNLEIVREIGPEMAASQPLRTNYATFLRAHLAKHPEFRAEAFTLMLARLLEHTSSVDFAALLEEASSLPELSQPAKPVLREEMAAAEFRRLHEGVVDSRWINLGRALGLTRSLHDPSAQTDLERLKEFKKRMRDSRWIRLGRKLNLLPGEL